MRKFLTIAAGVLALCGFGAGTAAAIDNGGYVDASSSNGYIHWTKDYVHSIRYAEQFLTGSGLGSDSRWLQTGHPTAWPLDGRYTGTWGYYAQLPTLPASNPADCTSPNAQICIQEVQDPNMTCPPGNPPGAAQPKIAGCTEDWWVDGLGHMFYSQVLLNWGVESTYPRLARETVYLHEIGHAFGHDHRTPYGTQNSDGTQNCATTLYSVMQPPACTEAIDQNDIDLTHYLNNHTDGSSYGYSTRSKRAGKRTYVIARTFKAGRQAANEVGGLTTVIVSHITPRTITEFSNGVIRVDKGGRTYWLGNKRLNKDGLDWYVGQDVLGKIASS